MDIRLSPFYHIHETGKRKNNEDAWLVSPDKRVYIVCDGVGGADRGEIASQTVCRRIADFFEQHPAVASDEQYIHAAVQYAVQGLQEYVAGHPEAENMATTLTLLHIHSNGITAAHMGDSRIYQIRDGRILFKTQDHSLVNDLVRAGLISADDAASHPQKNVITRALQASAEKSGQAEVQILTDVLPGDRFILCSDGILESFDDPALVQALSNSPKEAVDALRDKAGKYSNDNFTAILFEIAAIDGRVAPLPKAPASHVPVSARATVGQGQALTPPAVAPAKPVANKRRLYGLIALAAALLGAVAVYFLLKEPKKPGFDANNVPAAEVIQENEVKSLKQESDSQNNPLNTHAPVNLGTEEASKTPPGKINQEKSLNPDPAQISVKPSAAENTPRRVSGSRAENTAEKPKGTLSEDLKGTTIKETPVIKPTESKDDQKKQENNLRWFGNNG